MEAEEPEGGAPAATEEEEDEEDEREDEDEEYGEDVDRTGFANSKDNRGQEELPTQRKSDDPVVGDMEEEDFTPINEDGEWGIDFDDS